MSVSLDAAFDRLFDVIVIGGGINGAAIARDASLRGMKVALFEKDDFGSGASTKTSKLAHGGLRYLEHFEFHLVRESLKERALLLKNAPHLTKPIPFIFPVYKENPRPLWQINLGLYLYDFLDRQHALPKHHKLGAVQILSCFPGLKSGGLQGGCVYSDAQMQDHRILIENILAAEAAGALIFNHTPVTKISIDASGRADGVWIRHPVTGQEQKIKSRAVVKAVGAWSNLLGPDENRHVYPSKGVHLVIRQIASQNALLLRAPQDGRVFFIIPWGDDSLVGPTDTFYDGDPDHIPITDADQAYLLEALNYYFPERHFDQSSILSSFAGLRPLAANGSHKTSSDMTRKHVLELSHGNVVAVIGGKYTTHRQVAEETIDVIVRGFSDDSRFQDCRTAEIPLPGASGPYSFEQVKQKLRDSSGLTEPQIEHLVGIYGTNSLKMLEIFKDPEERKPMCSEHPHLLGEVVYAIQMEHAQTLEDWFFRRTTIAYTRCRGLKCVQCVADKFAKMLGWTEAHKNENIKNYPRFGS